jgi:hypothetical protein
MAKSTPDLLQPFRPLIDAERSRAAAEAASLERIEQAAERGARDRGGWLDKAGLAEHWRCSVRWIELRMIGADPIPHETIAGRVKFRVGEAEDWRERHPEDAPDA